MRLKGSENIEIFFYLILKSARRDKSYFFIGSDFILFSFCLPIVTMLHFTFIFYIFVLFSRFC